MCILAPGGAEMGRKTLTIGVPTKREPPLTYPLNSSVILQVEASENESRSGCAITNEDPRDAIVRRQN